MAKTNGASRPPQLTGMLAGLEPRHFQCILADPPWRFKSYAACQNPQSGRNVERHYPTMSAEEIKGLPIKDLTAREGCHLFLWATGPNLPLALQVMTAWGFKYSGVAFTWIKLRKGLYQPQLWIVPGADFHVGLGFTTRKNAEFCLLGRRGNARRLARDVRELIIAPRREHSRKPAETHERIERYAVGPYLELFGREPRPGWTVRGNETVEFENLNTGDNQDAPRLQGPRERPNGKGKARGRARTSRV